MTRLTKHILAGGLLIAALAGGWVWLSQATQPSRQEIVGTPSLAGSGVLDGLTFISELGLAGKPADVNDRLVFQNGLFVSTECDRRCGYPAQPYFARHVGQGVEFVSKARCLHKDASIAWRGTVEEGTIRGSFTWTTHRWYWTIEKEFWFEGKLVKSSAPKVSN